MTQRTLGLDMGPNSIGWALIDEGGEDVVAAGVRIFPEGVDCFDTSKEKSRNEDRRIARGMRRQTTRRAARKRKLQDSLISAGLFPADESEQQRLFALDPYELRTKALDEKLELFEIGRVLLHLNQRRDFLSNRKRDRGDSEVKGMLAEISELQQEIEDSGARTLGEYLFLKTQSFYHDRRVEKDHIRGRHTRRAMLESEFGMIWGSQAVHHPTLLTEVLRHGKSGPQSSSRKPIDKAGSLKGLSDVEAFGIQGMVFFQRKMYWPKSVIGLCELEPRQKRCPRADRHAQRFRLLQEVNNLKYVDPDTNTECRLSEDQRTLLCAFLSTREKATFDQIRKHLGFLESIKFNLERGKRPSLKGMTVDWLVAKAVGKEWHERPEDERDRIVRLLLDNEREDDALAERLEAEFGFTPAQADAALEIDFPDKYLHLSLMAIDKLLPHLRRGLILMGDDETDSAMHAAGYLRQDELQRRLFDKLPDPQRMNPRDCPIGDIPNPVVKRTLVELRKVVNAIVREYGKPDAVHVEMTRDLRMGAKARSEYNTRMREQEKRRDHAADEIRKFREQFPEAGVRVNRESILRFLLWEEQNHECVYCQKSISLQQLFGGEIDVDHILPRSRSLDDSQANKVVCHRKCNQDKGQRTPYEWLADADPQHYDRVCQQVASLMHKGFLRYGKYRKFLLKELELDTFIARQLSDAGYIARATAEYLRCLFEKRHNVLGLKGQHTAELRRQWGLNTVLRDDGLDLKTREDHRHHAVDAVIIALTDRSRLQALAKGTIEVERQNAQADENRHRQKYVGDRIAQPWEGFRDDVERAVNDIKTSHRAERKVAGALHEDSFYGKTDESDVFVKRKLLAELSPAEIEKIRDDLIRKLVIRRLQSAGIEFGRGKKADKSLMKQTLANVTMKSGVPVKKVRLLVPQKTIQPIREGSDDEAFVVPGATHHLALFEWEQSGKTKRDAVFVTQLEAINRVKRQQQELATFKETLRHEGLSAREIRRREGAEMSRIAREFPVIQRTPPVDHPTITAEARFLMSLSRGEMVLADWKGEEKLLVFRTAASTQGQIYFVEHTDARKSSEHKKFVAKANTLNARKVTVDPLGRIRWAND